MCKVRILKLSGTKPTKTAVLGADLIWRGSVQNGGSRVARNGPNVKTILALSHASVLVRLLWGALAFRSFWAWREKSSAQQINGKEATWCLSYESPFSCAHSSLLGASAVEGLSQPNCWNSRENTKQHQDESGKSLTERTRPFQQRGGKVLIYRHGTKSGKYIYQTTGKSYGGSLYLSPSIH